MYATSKHVMSHKNSTTLGEVWCIGQEEPYHLLVQSMQVWSMLIGQLCAYCISTMLHWTLEIRRQRTSKSIIPESVLDCAKDTDTYVSSNLITMFRPIKNNFSMVHSKLFKCIFLCKLRFFFFKIISIRTLKTDRNVIRSNELMIS